MNKCLRLTWVTRVTWVDMGVRGDLVLISKTMHRRERSGKCVEEIFHSMLWAIIALEDLSPFAAKNQQIHILNQRNGVWCAGTIYCACISFRKERKWDPE